MADWSQLPKELLHLITERLDSALYLLRFRSVCSSWRASSSSIPNLHHHQHLTFNFPILSEHPTTTIPHNHHNDFTFSVSKCTVFLITPPQQQRQQQTLSAPLHPWLIKMGQDPHGRTHLWHPLVHIRIKPIPRQLDLYELPVFDLGQEFVLNEMDSRSLISLSMKKVVFSWLGSKKEGFVLLTINVLGKLALFRSGDKGWTIIPDMPTPYDDVCVYKGKLCAVDNTGRTVEVGLDSSVSLLADSVFGGDEKFLVECGGELLLVDKYLSSYLGECVGIVWEGGDYEEIYEFGCKRAVKFEVYRLEEEERKWVELASLGDRVLFLGDACAFCASVSDLCVRKGDCVIFRNDTFKDEHESGMCVFYLGEHRISRLSDYPDYSKLFWPPPDWVRLH